ncbi:MAG TPA: nicotinate (nicotinamide) nucleotide adenylyltransferase [Anaerohalosphaeraceae bacterium]|nr:nicotinate (nicotinamide) nucleotide adenylyltransferase [Anaerohalosphaeraceae bacterium]HOL89666.1 nicotinate (nicotinamide) nucleotide adenylyltransferase [Anaerohalosphaeraceae bacterium]HPP54980.1 nicotinate (nicotinamide) nucleotide adenylyltransferase [Anaerohalosphaeraceae bacterium]
MSFEAMQNKIVLFGGTFDPVHSGHLQVADAARRHLNAERVIFIPARRPPHKSEPPAASEQDRMQMLRLALNGWKDFQVSDCEYHRPEPSFTVDTVEEFRRRLPFASLVWLVGADAVKDLPRWHQIDRLMALCTLAVMYRAGYPKPDFTPCKPYFTAEQIRRLQEHIVPVPLLDISATEIRRRLACGQDVEGLLPASVLEYIRSRGLYGCRR